MTFQVLGVALSGYLLGPYYGTLSVVVYLLLGAVGLPVFSGFCGGLPILFGPGGGFLWGFVLLGVCCSVRCAKKWHKIGVSFIGLALCHLLGCIQFAAVTATAFWSALATVSLPFLWKDALLLAVAFRISSKIP